MKYLGFLLGAILWASSAFGQSADDIEDVIGNQLQAFNDRNVEGAWQYAAPNIQGMFGNPQNFGVMVQRGYPMVWTNRDVRFLELQDLGAVQIQRIMLRDMSGGIHVLEYQMVQTSLGWRIAGVQILPAPDIGA